MKACYPADNAEALRLWHDIKPVKFGNRTAWTVAQDYILAEYRIPEDASYMVILRVECYVTTNIATAAGFGMFGPPPPPGTNAVRWQYLVAGSQEYNITAQVPTHLLCDTDEMLIGKGGNHIRLVAGLAANPTADARFILTTVYAYNLGAIIADKIGGAETTQFSNIV